MPTVPGATSSCLPLPNPNDMRGGFRGWTNRFSFEPVGFYVALVACGSLLGILVMAVAATLSIMTQAESDSISAPVAEGSIQIRVRYCECDPMGVAHHASYAPWLEMGRTELLRDIGVTYAQLEASGVFLVITKLELWYRRPVRYDDVIEVRTRVVGGSKVKIRHEYEIVLVGRGGGMPRTEDDPSVPADGVCCVASTELVCVTREGKVRALPRELLLGG